MPCINANLVVEIAEMIARHDFRVSVSRSVVYNRQTPWFITVAGTDWERSLELLEHNPDGTDADLVVLGEDGSATLQITLVALLDGGHNSAEKRLLSRELV